MYAIGWITPRTDLQSTGFRTSDLGARPNNQFQRLLRFVNLLPAIPRRSRNLQHAKYTEPHALLETGGSGISRIRAFWRVRMASVAFTESGLLVPGFGF